MNRSQFIRLCDIRDAIDEIEEMSSGADFASYKEDRKLRRATERCVEIISEASRHVPDSVKAEFSEIPWHEISAIGNLLRHEYQIVSDFVMWKISGQSLTDLRRVVSIVIDRIEQAQRKPK